MKGVAFRAASFSHTLACIFLASGGVEQIPALEGGKAGIAAERGS